MRIMSDTNLEQKKALFVSQKETLDTFLAHGAITKEQYEKSLTGLKVKMGLPIDVIEELLKDKTEAES